MKPTPAPFNPNGRNDCTPGPHSVSIVEARTNYYANRGISDSGSIDRAASALTSYLVCKRGTRRIGRYADFARQHVTRLVKA